MIRRPPRSTRTDTLFPYTKLFRSAFRRKRGLCVSGRLLGGTGREPPAGFANFVSDELAHKAYCRKVSHIGIHCQPKCPADIDLVVRSEEHTSEPQSLMRISYAVFCLKKKKNTEFQQISKCNH